MRKNIKNYTTTISVQKTISEIQQLLSQVKANQIMIDYDGSGEPISLIFTISTNRGMIGFKLPARVENVAKIMYPGVSRFYVGDKRQEQYKRTAWRNIKDWIDSQVALVQTDMVKPEEVFLPYAVNKGQTLFESFESGNLLPAGEEESL